jgi:hypothetical protein
MTDAVKSTTPARETMPMSAWASSPWAKYLYWFGRLLDKLTFGHARLHIYLFCAQPIGSGAFAAMRDDPNTVVQPVPPDSPLVAHFIRPPEVIRHRFAAGTTCYAATVKGEFAGHIWLASGFFDEDEVRCRYVFPANQPIVWDYDVYIEPRYRLGRTLGRLWKGVDAALDAQGIHWSVSRISLFNAASIQTHERLGAVYLTTGVFVVIGPLQLSIFSQAPYLHVGVRPAHRPALTLQPPKILTPVDTTRRPARLPL